MKGTIVTEDFKAACREYFYLIGRDYPERGTLKLVGDRRRLSRDQRTVLYRGISSSLHAARRSKKLTRQITGCRMLVDGYNVLFTLLNYRLGRFLFLSTDRYLRDAGALHGKIRNEALLRECAGLMMVYLSAERPVQIDIYLDSPVSHSQKHAGLLQAMMDEHGLKGTCYVVHSADWPLKRLNNGIIATSDSVILDQSEAPVFDLSRHILERAFQATFVDLKEYCM